MNIPKKPMCFPTAIIAFAALLISSCYGNDKLTELISFAATKAYSDKSSGGYNAEILWLNDSMIIVSARSKHVEAFDPASALGAAAGSVS